MYVPFQDATFVPVTFDAGTYTHGDITLPRVDAIAAKDKMASSGWKSPILIPISQSRSKRASPASRRNRQREKP